MFVLRAVLLLVLMGSCAATLPNDNSVVGARRSAKTNSHHDSVEHVSNRYYYRSPYNWGIPLEDQHHEHHDDERMGEPAAPKEDEHEHHRLYLNHHHSLFGVRDVTDSK